MRCGKSQARGQAASLRYSARVRSKGRKKSGAAQYRPRPISRGLYLPRTGVSTRSWKSKLKSVAGETGFIVAPETAPSGVSEKVT
jgi:hypothetical protein